MYDMYAWDQSASSADEHTEPSVAPRDAGRAASATQVAYASRANRAGRADHPGRADHSSRAVHAVQVALDRRDNGGDAGSGRLG